LHLVPARAMIAQLYNETNMHFTGGWNLICDGTNGKGREGVTDKVVIIIKYETKKYEEVYGF
jgi:hypothetical protein